MCSDEINVLITLIWKWCCLKTYKIQIESLILEFNYVNSDINTIFSDCQSSSSSSSLSLSSSSSCCSEFYSLTLLQDTESLTLKTLLTFSLCHHDLLYYQFYNSCKKIFAAENYYFFENKNIDTLSLDLKLVHIWAHVDWVISHQSKTLRTAYLHIKKWCHKIIQAAQNWFFDVCLKFCVKEKLVLTIHSEMMKWEEMNLKSSWSVIYHHTSTLLN